MTRKPKRPLASWTRAFPEQHKALHPERTAAGGVKARSQSKAIRDAVYDAINALYATAHPYCAACHVIWPDKIREPLHFRDDTHHTRGKDGLLYFDVRYFLSVCRKAHQWIDANRAEAVKLGLLSKEWNKQG